MEWLYLLLAAFGARLTWNLYAPVVRHPRRAALSWIAGWLTGELALHWIAAQVLVTLLFYPSGAFATVVGRLGLLLSLVSWGALAYYHNRARRAAGPTEQALVEGLGTDYRNEIDPSHAQHFPPALDWRAVVDPLPRLPSGVRRQNGIRFGRERGTTLKLDIIRPRDQTAPCPTLLHIHGGAWMYGRRGDQALPLLYHMAERGWVVATVDYRLSPGATFPEHLIDVKRALAWLRDHAADYGIDPSFIVVTGGSAGGHLAALMALSANDPRYQPDFEFADTQLQGCVPFYGVFDFVDRHGDWPNDALERLLERDVMKASVEEASEDYERASPINQVHEKAPPFFILHGDCDSLVPVSMARRFASGLREKSHQAVCYAELPGAQHAFDLFGSLRSLHSVHAVERFLAHAHSRHLRSRTSAASENP